LLLLEDPNHKKEEEKRFRHVTVVSNSTRKENTLSLKL